MDLFNCSLLVASCTIDFATVPLSNYCLWLKLYVTLVCSAQSYRNIFPTFSRKKCATKHRYCNYLQLMWMSDFVSGRPGTEEFVPGHLLLPLSRDKGTPGQGKCPCPGTKGQRDVLSRFVKSFDIWLLQTGKLCLVSTKKGQFLLKKIIQGHKGQKGQWRPKKASKVHNFKSLWYYQYSMHNHQ